MSPSKLAENLKKKKQIVSGEIPKPKTVFLEFKIRVDVTPELIKELNSKNETDLIKLIEAGEPIFEVLNFNEKSDVFELCSDYLKTIKTHFFNQKSNSDIIFTQLWH